MNSPMPPGWAEAWKPAQKSLKKSRTRRWWNISLWPHWMRHAWVTRKCQWDANVQTSLFPMIDIEPDWENPMWKNKYTPDQIPTGNGKYPTVLTKCQLESLSKGGR